MGEEINSKLAGLPSVGTWGKPQIFDLNTLEDAAALDKLIETEPRLIRSDNITEAIDELYHIEYPEQIDSINEDEYKKFTAELGDLDKFGCWVYFPWNFTLVHFPPVGDLRKLRGSRNRNLITEEERIQLVDNKTILILGLSVGSNAVDSLMMQGIGSKYVLVDMDSLSPTNLNRIRASYDQVGLHKIDVVAKKVSELDPFIEQVHYRNGLNEENLEEILTKHKPDIIIDEMDSLHLKLIVRNRAKEAGIPVLMATDDGDDILLDIERFDQKPDQPILHGIMPDEVIERILKNEKMSRQEMGAIIGKYFVNLKYVPLRMLESLLEVGKSLPSWPQLGGAAVLSGIALAYAAKKILLGQPLNEGRFLLGFEDQLNPQIKSKEYVEKKDTIIKLMTGNGN